VPGRIKTEVVDSTDGLGAAWCPMLVWHVQGRVPSQHRVRTHQALLGAGVHHLQYPAQSVIGETTLLSFSELSVLPLKLRNWFLCLGTGLISFTEVIRE
jgi:hypothetical protein